MLGTAGLENTGNICFINAALQCIFNAVPLTDYFLTGVYMEEVNLRNPLGTHGEISEAYAEVLEVQWLQAHECLLPKKLLTLIFKSAPQFSDGRQHDAHELLAFLLDILHEDLNRADPRARPAAIPDEKVMLDEDRAALSWKAYLERNSSVVVDLFQGQLRSSVTCVECGFVSTTFDTFMYLSLPIPKKNGPMTLVDCLMEFAKVETLDQSWHCQKCKKSVKAKKKIDIWKVPPLLIIHLKRFYYHKTSFGKLNNRIEYPTTHLDIGSYVSSPQKEPPLYNLFAKTDHEGEMASGHYSAYAKNRRSQIWFHFDDKAYMLFYCKVSIPEYRRQSTRLPDLWPHMISQKASIESEDFPPDQTGSTVSIPEKSSSRRPPLKVIPSVRESPRT